MMIPPYTQTTMAHVLHALSAYRGPAILMSFLLVTGMVFLLGCATGLFLAEQPIERSAKQSRVLRVHDQGAVVRCKRVGSPIVERKPHK